MGGYGGGDWVLKVNFVFSWADLETSALIWEDMKVFQWRKATTTQGNKNTETEFYILTSVRLSSRKLAHQIWVKKKTEGFEARQTIKLRVYHSLYKLRFLFRWIRASEASVAVLLRWPISRMEMRLLRVEVAKSIFVSRSEFQGICRQEDLRTNSSTWSQIVW